jgi:hypothetical protein
MQIFLVVVVSVFGGICLAALAVFCYSFYNALQRLTSVTETVYNVLKPMADQKFLPDLMATMQKTSTVGAEITRALQNINRTAATFNRMMTATAQQPVAEVPETQYIGPESAFIAPTEEELAIREQQEELRKQGIETAPENMQEPDLAMMNGANV